MGMGVISNVTETPSMRQTRTILIAAFGCLALAACSKGSASTTNTTTSTNTTDTVTTAQAAPAPPEHRYTAKEGEDYGYVAAVSDDDRKAGQTAGDVIMYRYLGQSDGVYTLAMTDKPDALIQCTNPCQMVKVTLDGAVIKRTAFTDDSVIGSAFHDAFDGQLAVYGAAAMKAQAAQQAQAAQTAVYTYDIPKKMPSAYRTWKSEVSSDLASYDYIAKLDGVSGPMKTVMVGGQPMLYGTSCMPHDCAANMLGVLVGPKGRIVGVNNMPDAVGNQDTTLIGDATDAEQACLRGKLADADHACS